MFERRITREVKAGNVRIGNGSPVSIQSMTNTHTRDVKATLDQIDRLVKAGADLVRVAVPTPDDTKEFGAIVKGSAVPIVADVHFHFQRALEAIEAGAAKIRLNPGNIGDRAQVDEVIAACRERTIPIRVGVNEGSIVERKQQDVRAEHQAMLAKDPHGGLVRLMVDRLREYLAIFEENDFHDVVLSVKAIDPPVVIEACRAVSKEFDYPLHLGVTHAGTPETGRIRSISALATLLAEGIGDTIRISYAADPVLEVLDAKELLYCLGLRDRTGPDLIACPTCGRLEVDLMPLVEQVRERLKDIHVPMRVAVMGCVVNGPGEAEGADVAVCAGKGAGLIYVRGKKVRTVPEDEILDALYAECMRFAVQESEHA